jgi:putative membrane protein
MEGEQSTASRDGGRTSSPFSSRLALVAFMAVAVVGLAISGIAPHDRITWWLEVLPVVIALPLLGWTHERFPLTWLAYALITLHALILMLGGHYTYAQVPLGYWMQQAFDLSRNHYDRIGHFAQGFVPAILAREILLRNTPLRPGGWLFVIVVAVCMAVSVLYEFLEWWSALIGGVAAEQFLGTQGDVWDTQWDMFFATLGAIASLLLLSKLHDRTLASLRAQIRSNTHAPRG